MSLELDAIIPGIVRADDTACTVPVKPIISPIEDAGTFRFVTGDLNTEGPPTDQNQQAGEAGDTNLKHARKQATRIVMGLIGHL
jgi:hypothetical protein